MTKDERERLVPTKELKNLAYGSRMFVADMARHFKVSVAT